MKIKALWLDYDWVKENKLEHYKKVQNFDLKCDFDISIHKTRIKHGEYQYKRNQYGLKNLGIEFISFNSALCSWFNSISDTESTFVELITCT